MIIDKIQISGQNYDIRDASAVTVVDILQADYDELPESAKTSNIIYNITDAPQININEYVSKAENVIPDTWVYLISDYMNLQIQKSWHINFIKFECNQGYTPQDTVYCSFGVENNLGNLTNGYFNLDYANKVATGFDANLLNVEYDEEIEDFYATVVPSDTYFVNFYISNSQIKVLLPFKHITSGQSATVIKDGVEPILSDLYSSALSSIKSIGVGQGGSNVIDIIGYKDFGNPTNSSIALGKSIINKDNKLEANVKVPLGISAWTEVQIIGCSKQVNVRPIFRVKYVNRPNGFRLYLNGNWGSNYNYLQWNDSIQDYSFERGIFDGTNEGFSAATFTHDAENKIITFTYPLTVQPSGWQSQENVNLYEIYSYDCDFGSNETFEYYAELEQDIVPYVQGKQDTLSAGTGIDITNNVISVTGGGGGSSYTAGYGIDIDTANTISVTGQVASSAITTAVTTASTDSEIPTAKAVNDAIAAGGGGGGGKAVSAGTNISITTGETADTINCTLPISANTTSGGRVLNIYDDLQYENIKAPYNSINIGIYNKCDMVLGSGTEDYDVFIGGFNKYKRSQYGGYTGYNLIFGKSNVLSGERPSHSCVFGEENTASGNPQYSFAFGKYNCTANDYNFAFGASNNCNNRYEAVFGTFNVSNTGSTDANKTIFSVGNGTGNDARHNVLEIRKNGDIYISSGGTDIKLQDNLGGGGGGGTVDQTVISGSTNAVAGGAVYDQLGGMKIVKLTESEYTALVTKDADTLYVVIPDPSN